MAVIAKYKFNSTLYADLIPGFNAEFTNYTVTDEATETDSKGNVIKTRVIEHDTLLPTYIRFGVAISDISTNRELSLLEVIELNTTELTNCNRMFIGCKNVTSINTEGWILNKVTAMQYMFYKCENLTSLDVSNFDTSNVNTMEAMFYCCNNLTSLDVSNWNTSKVTVMLYMFHDCHKLTTLDVSNFDISKVTDMDGMFIYTPSLQYIKCNNTSTINTLASSLPSRTSSTQGKIITSSSTNVDTTTLSSLNWSVDTSSGTKIAEYVYDKSICNYLVPEFNEGYGGYFVSNRIEDESKPNIVTREVVGYGGLPVHLKFGYYNGGKLSEYEVTSLLSVNYVNTDNLHPTYGFCMFSNCTNLASLDVSNFDTSGMTNTSWMFSNCTNLASLDVSDFDTSSVTDMYSMFNGCKSLTSLDVSNFNTSKVTTMSAMFYDCQNLTSLDLSNWDISEVTDMNSMFANCYKLTQLDVSNWDTSNVTSIYSIFFNCNKLINLDLSDWNTTNFTNLESMFNGCQSLQNLDISNFKLTSSMNIKNLFYNISSGIKNIGMLYCDKDTINLISSALGTITNRTIWVEGSMIDDLTSYDNVTYKAYYWEKEVLLNSPLLEGDKIVKKNGKIYHYHKMGMIVLDGSEDWQKVGETVADGLISKYYYPLDFPLSNTTSIKPYGKIFSNNLKTVTYTESLENVGIINANATFIIVKENDGVDIPQWLQENPTTVVYELANPYYELISDTSDDLSLPLVSEDNIISNNSLIPTNMNVKNNGMSTVAMNTSTKYTVAFDKDTDSSVTINLCGSTIDTTDNVVEITTPSELANDEITFIGDCKVSNVRILEGSVSGDAIPKESFEGLKNSFEDGKSRGIFDFNGVLIQGKDLNENTGEIEDNIYSVCCEEYIQAKPNTTYKVYDWGNFDNKAVENTRYCFYDKNKIYLGVGNASCSTTPENCSYIRIRFVINDNYDIEKAQIQLEEGAVATEYIPYGKYKVEYKVTGKNKFDGELIQGAWNSDDSFVNTQNYICTKNRIKVNPSSEYKISGINKTANIVALRKDFSLIKVFGVNTNEYYTTPDDCAYVRIDWYDATSITASDYPNIQIEEGTTATEYEPYKEYTKTFYLNSPLLEGDTIEDVNGVATHVKRSEKVVLDGSEDEEWIAYQQANTAISYGAIKLYDMKQSIQSVVICDNYVSTNDGNKYDASYTKEQCYPYCYGVDINYNRIYFHVLNSKLPSCTIEGFRQWFTNNPTTVVYQLASPVYEPISTESILCDSYVNGHLDVDSNIPVEKVQFRNWYKGLRYTSSNTTYKVQFESDNVGEAQIILCGKIVDLNVVKGVNTVELTSLSTYLHNNINIIGIGFNASNIQVVATDRDNIGYFKGIQSSFEDKVIRNKNLFNKNNIVFNSIISQIGNIENSNTYCRTKHIECKPNTPYTCNVGTGIHYFDENKTWLGYQNHNTLSPSNAKYLMKNIRLEVDLDTVQIEEGIESTTYEEYNIYNGKYEVKVTLEDENGVISNEFIYLNSPLLKGDRIEMYNGKLCHYHKMGSVVLDGSENWVLDGSNDEYSGYYLNNSLGTLNFSIGNSQYCISDKFPTISSTYWKDLNTEGCIDNTGNIAFVVKNTKLSTVSVTGFIQWLQANPTTVVYELAEPHYEDITPIQNEFVITSIGESSFTIDSGAIPTDGEITYSVNVKLLNDLEESINNNTSSTDTDLSTILDDIINE